MIAIAGLYIAATISMAPFVRHKLQQLVADHLHARLEMADLSYRFPYGVTVRDASFAADRAHGDVELLRVKRLDLSLASLPFRRGPITIRNVTLTEPTIRIVRDESGALIGPQLARRAATQPLPDWRTLKLSDLLLLRRFDIRRANVIFDDRSQPPADAAAPMRWTDLNASLRLEPATVSRYNVHFVADNAPIAELDLSAVADVDAWTVDVSKLAMSVHVTDDARARSAGRAATSRPLPPALQQLLDSLGAEGRVQFTASGAVPLKDLKSSKIALDAQLDGVRLAPKNRDWVLDGMGGLLRAQFDERGIRFDLSDATARGMGGRLTLSRAGGNVAADWKSWQIETLTGRVVADPAMLPAAMPATVPANSPPDPADIRPPDIKPPATKFAFLAGAIDFDGSAAGSLARDQRWPGSANFVAKLDRVSIQPPRFGQPIEQISGVARLLDPSTLLIENVAGDFGSDHYAISQARVSLAKLPLRWEATGIVAHAVLAQPGPVYPRPLTATMAALRPDGPFEITGAFSVYRGRGRNEPDFSLAILPRSAGLTITRRNFHISDLNGEMNVAPRLVTINYLQGSVLGGTIATKGTVIPRPPIWEDPSRRTPVKYDGIITLGDIDVGAFSTAMGMTREDGTPKATGRAAAHAHAQGLIPARAIAVSDQSPNRPPDRPPDRSPGQLPSTEPSAEPSRTWQDELVARGGVRIDDGDLWSADILSKIVGETKVAPDALTVSQAAAVFDVRERRIELERVAISSPAVGVQGSGAAGFDGGLDLSVIVAPLGDWREGMKKTGLSIISDVAGEVVGAIQKLLNTATSQLLYQFRVEGTAKDPKISAVPAPMLTEGAAQLFETMLRGSKSEKLAEQIGAENDRDEQRPPR